MTESIAPASGSRADGRSGLGVPAALAVVLAVALSTWGTFGDHFHSENLRELAVVFGIIGLATAVVFGWIVPRGLRREAAGTRALALSVLGFLSIAVFWSGLPPVLAVGGIVLGWAGRNAARGSLACRTAIVLGVLALAADVLVFVQDQAF